MFHVSSAIGDASPDRHCALLRQADATQQCAPLVCGHEHRPLMAYLSTCEEPNSCRVRQDGCQGSQQQQLLLNHLQVPPRSRMVDAPLAVAESLDSGDLRRPASNRNREDDSSVGRGVK